MTGDPLSFLFGYKNNIYLLHSINKEETISKYNIEKAYILSGVMKWIQLLTL